MSPRIKQMGPQNQYSDQLHSLKYRQTGETFRDAMNRIAYALKDDDEHYHVLRDILLSMRFMPAGRIQSAMGSSRETTPYNCYVSGTIEDSFVDGEGSIMERAKEAAATMRMGGGIGYDFSTLRPRGDLIRKLQSHSTGPVSFMKIFNEVCLCTSSSGHRRGAQMGVLRVDHPDVFEFVNAKNDQHTLSGFNISVAVTDEFMEAVINQKPFALKWGGRVYREIDALQLWENIMRSTWDWADPGVLFIDAINRMNNLYYCETIAATNPCGEQPLPPFGACLLGSLNLVKYLVPQPIRLIDAKDGAAPNIRWAFDYDLLKADIPYIVRALDNVVDRARYPLPQQEIEAKSKRRMGIGVTALANCAEALGFAYGTPAFLEFEGKLLDFIANECYTASAYLAATKGSFPLYDEEKYLAGNYVKTLRDDVIDKIKRYGIRNSHLTSIAPTGTISMCADNVSSGIEPVFSYMTERPINTPDGPIIVQLQDYAVANLGVKGKTLDDVTAQEHVAVLTTATRHVDSAVSKTCNVTGKMEWADFKTIYQSSWEGGAKGCTTFNIDGKKMALLKAAASSVDNEGATCKIDLETGQKECA